jgi:lipoprotein NlpI
MFKQKMSMYALRSSPALQLEKGQALHQKGMVEQARAIYEDILRVNPDHIDALHFLGILQDQLKNHRLAIELITKSIQINPNNPAQYLNLGNAQQNLRMFDASLDSYAKAISLKPDYALAYVCRGSALQRLMRLGAAIECFDMAIAIDKNLAMAYWNKSTALLLTGVFDPGLNLYEWRWKTPNFGLVMRRFPQPYWLGGESLKGKTIFLHNEQGIGDCIQFCRYVKILASLGASVILETIPQLQGLFQSLDGVSELHLQGTTLPSFDFHCSVSSLPLALNTRLETIPNSQSYLRCDPRKAFEWASKLGKTRSKRIGLVWSGQKLHVDDHNRSISLSTLVDHLPNGFEYFSLQKEVRDSDAKALEAHPEIRHFGDALCDFSDTAALCALMDVVISIDTSVAHLSGALGRPTWILLPHMPDWRWLLNRNDTPWYPTATLYRQDSAGEWGPTLEKINAELLAYP